MNNSNFNILAQMVKGLREDYPKPVGRAKVWYEKFGLDWDKIKPFGDLSSDGELTVNSNFNLGNNISAHLSKKSGDDVRFMSDCFSDDGQFFDKTFLDELLLRANKLFLRRIVGYKHDVKPDMAYGGDLSCLKLLNSWVDYSRASGFDGNIKNLCEITGLGRKEFATYGFTSKTVTLFDKEHLVTPETLFSTVFDYALKQGFFDETLVEGNVFLGVVNFKRIFFNKEIKYFRKTHGFDLSYDGYVLNAGFFVSR